MENEENRLMILGYSKSRLEIFINGIVFLLIQCAYEIYEMINQLPVDWTEKDVYEVQRPFFIPIFLMVISYSLINFSIFGGQGRLEKMQERYGTFGILARKLTMYTILGILSITIPPIFIAILSN